MATKILTSKKQGAINEGEFVTIRQAAEFTHSSEPTIRRRLTQKELTRFKFGARTLIKASELLALIKPASAD